MTESYEFVVIKYQVPIYGYPIQVLVRYLATIGPTALASCQLLEDLARATKNFNSRHNLANI